MSLRSEQVHVAPFTAADLEGAIAAGKPILIDFWAEWCGPCRMLKPELAKAAAILKDEVDVRACNVDEEQQLAGMFQVQGIPNMSLLVGNNVIAAIVGFRPADQIVADVRAALAAYAAKQAEATN